MLYGGASPPFLAARAHLARVHARVHPLVVTSTPSVPPNAVGPVVDAPAGTDARSAEPLASAFGGAPLDDPVRLGALEATGLLRDANPSFAGATAGRAHPASSGDTLTGDPLTRVARLAAWALRAPIAQVNLVDTHRQVPVAAYVAPDTAPERVRDAASERLSETMPKTTRHAASDVASDPPRARSDAADPGAWRTPVTLAASLCQHVVTSGAPLVLDDARTDPRARDNAAVTEAGLVGYCSVPMRAPAGPGAPPGTGPVVGSVCVVDLAPRRWTAEHVAALADLAAVAEAELARRTAERRLRALADAMPLVVWTATPEGRTDFLNRRWADLTGQDPVAALAEGTDAYVHPDDLPGIAEAWRRRLPGGAEEGEDFSFEYRLRLRDGTYRWFLGRMVAERTADVASTDGPADARRVRGDAADRGVVARGAIARWVGTGTDITEQKQAAEALMAANAQLAAQAADLASANHQLQDQAVELEAANQQLQEQAAELEATSEELQVTASHLEEQIEAAARADAARASAERGLRSALLAGEVGTFEWDITRQRVWGDANFARLFGIPLDADGSAPLERYIDVIHPDDRTAMRAAVARTVEDGADYEVEYRVLLGAPVGRGPAAGGADAEGGADDAPGAAPAGPPVRWLLVRAKPEHALAPNGTVGPVVRAAGVCLDVTARKAAEDALRRGTLLLQAISETTGDVIYAKDRAGRLIYGNPATFALIGKPAAAALGRTDAEFLDDVEAARRVMANDARIMASGQGEELEEVVPRPDGARRVWLSSKMPYRDEAGRIVGLLGVSRDITERVESRRRLAAALTAGEVGTFEWDIVADRLYGDANFARMFGIALDADGAAPLGAYLAAIHPDDRARVVAAIERTVAIGTPYEAEYRIVSGAGALGVAAPGGAAGGAGEGGASAARWVVARGSVERDPATGRAVRFPGTVLDITARVAAEAAERAARAAAEEARGAAEAANQAKALFLANMSHELRTPLNAIGGYVQLLEMGLHGPVTDEQRATLGRVQLAQTRLLALINDILNYAKLESGKVEYDVQAVDVRAVVREIAPLVEPQVRARGLTLVLDLPVDPAPRHASGDRSAATACLVWADREKLGQVLVNLLTNAIKFTAPTNATTGAPGRIEVRVATRRGPAARPAAAAAGAHDRGDRAEPLFLQVRDTGIGVPRDKQEAIFEPFVQVRTREAYSFAQATEGTGLGLAISRDLTRGMGGDLRVRSREGAGSTFTVTLRRVLDATGHPTDRRTVDERREEERRSGEDRREGASEQPLEPPLEETPPAGRPAPRDLSPRNAARGDALHGGASPGETSPTEPTA